MIDTLEYKILRYLKDNDNGEFIDLSEFISDLKLLRIKLSSLSKKPEKYISFHGGNYTSFGDGNNLKTECTLAKIEFSGIKYLNEIEKEPKIITNNFNNNFEKSTIGQVVQSSEKLELNNTIKQKINLETPKSTNKNPIFSKLIEYWWMFVIAVFAGVILILIEKRIIPIGFSF